MNTPRLRLRTVLALALAFTTSCNVHLPDPTVTVEEAYLELCSDAPGSASLFFTMRTNNDPTKLVSITTAGAERVELRDAGGVIAPGDTSFGPDRPLVFAPAGKRAILRDLKRGLKPGDRLPITFNVEPASPLSKDVEVRLNVCKGWITDWQLSGSRS